jgi:hypothetical protein
MKIKTILSLLLSFSFYVLSSQVPQGMNYQAIARDGTGNPITGVTLQVKIGILSDTITPVVVWEELHSTVKTNAFGMFTLVIGTGVRQSGSALSFSDIDWTVLPLYLKTQIFYQGSWKYMGTSILWAVPYSMVAGNLGGSLKNLEVVGDDVSSDEALFEVKRKDGQTMFAVYNHGVRVYMPLDTLSKARKGGFAIGGFDKSKGTVQDYFVVNPDSIRAYIDTNTAKGRKGGFAIGGFDKSKSVNEEYLRVTRDSTRVYLNDTGTKSRKGGFAIGGFDRSKADIQDFFTVSSDSIRMYIDDNISKARKGGFAIGGFDKSKGINTSFLNVATETSGIIFPSENRIMWYPIKNAFLTGKVLIEKPDSIGINSFASGYESKAKGQYSQALGYMAAARGDYSTAIGKNATANRINSFSFGDNVISSGQNSYVFGKNSKASGDGSYAFGFNAKATGQDSYAIGTGAEAQGTGSVAIGFIGRDSAGVATGNTLATYDYAIAIGMGAQATATGAFAEGVLAKAKNDFATAIGYQSEASGNYGSLAVGYKSSAKGNWSTALGNWCEATQNGSTSIGSNSTASGYCATAMGGYNLASGSCATALGGWTKATGFNSSAFGYQTIANGEYSTAVGINTVAKGFTSTAMGNRTVASGYFTTAFGYYSISKPWGCLVIGQNNDTTCSVNGETSWNITDPLFICGNGISRDFRSNAFTVYKNGNTYIQGNLGIGTTNPGTRLAISGLTGTTSGSYLRVYNDNIYYYSSSLKTKTNIEPLNEDFYKILQAQPVSFIDKVSGERNIGFIAEDFDSIGLKNLVIYKNGEPVSLSYELVSIYNLEIIKDQQKQIENQKIENQQLRSELNELRTLVNILLAKQNSQDQN